MNLWGECYVHTFIPALCNSSLEEKLNIIGLGKETGLVPLQDRELQC